MNYVLIEAIEKQHESKKNFKICLFVISIKNKNIKNSKVIVF